MYIVLFNKNMGCKRESIGRYIAKNTKTKEKAKQLLKADDEHSVLVLVILK
jgi:hypothetical protein